MPKKKGFFNIDEAVETEIPITPSETEEERRKNDEVSCETVSANGEVSVKRSSKAFIILAAVIVTVAALLLVRWLYNNVDDDVNKYVPDEWLQGGDKTGATIYLYTPDWETDIYTIPEYTSKLKDIFYIEGSYGRSVDEYSYVSVGGNGLKFIADYIETLKRGDHEKLNSMFTDEYFKDNKKYEAFPAQKVFDVNVTKYSYSDPKYNGNDMYYIVSYRIYRNDGLFRNDIDDVAELPQLFRLIEGADGSIRIDKVIDLPGYLNRI